MRSALTLLLGLAIGAAAVILFRGSMMPDAGTPEARILELENELRETRLRLAKIDPDQARAREDSGGALRTGIRSAFDDLRAGRPVDLNRLYQATKPLLRDLAPLFNNIRRREERRMNERISGELGRKYNLTEVQQTALREWLTARSAQNEAVFNAVALADGTRLDDLVRATKDLRPDDGLDAFMETQLAGAELSAFKKERLEQRAERVQNEADWKVERLHQTVGLDEAQKDQVFSIMARSSRDFDPRMQLEGVSADGPAVGTDGRDAAIMEVLRPDQQSRYQSWRDERRARTEQEMAEIGLKMPEGWDALTQD